ncbi:DNA binding / DNA-directed RNA polymerase [Wolffia australiana]
MADEKDEFEEGIPSSAKKKKMNKKKKSKKKQLNVRVEAVTESADRSAPLVGYFPSGYDPLKGAEEGQEPKIRVFRHPQRAARLELVVSPRLNDGSESNVEFVGTSYTGEATNPQFCTYALGVINKETQSLRIVPIAANKIFRLEPRVKGKSEEELQKEDPPAESMLEKRILLTNLYGSKRHKTVVNRRSTLKKQMEDPNAKESLENQMKGVEVNKEAFVGSSGNTFSHIPPHDLTATSPEKAYIIDEIIQKREWNHLLDVFYNLESTESSSESWEQKGYPTFVCNRIQKLKEIQDEEEKRKLAGILSYITHLLKFLEIASQPRKTIVEEHGSSTNHRIPRITYNKFVGLFIDRDSCNMPFEGKNLLISYLLVLTLFADNFKTEPLDIAQDLKMTFLNLKPMYQLLGCQFQQEGRLNVSITLRVPLQLPELQKKRRRPLSTRR